VLLLAAQPGFAKPLLIKLNAYPVFSGKLKESKDCRAGRTVKLIDAANGDVVARAITNRKGKFNKPSTFGGSGSAATKKKVVLGEDGNDEVCSAARSELVTHLGLADLHLSIGNVSELASGGVQFEVSVQNQGPNTAPNVQMTLTSNSKFNSAESDTVGGSCIPTTNVGNQVQCAYGLWGVTLFRVIRVSSASV
jgi:uncharacterized protein DUF11